MAWTPATARALKQVVNDLEEVGAAWRQDPLAAVKALTDMVAILEEARENAIRDALAGKASWAAIGSATATSKQTAWSRWRTLSPSSRRHRAR